MTHFADRLFQKIKEKKSVLCVGLDPHVGLLPEVVTQGKSITVAAEEFLMNILEKIAPYTVAVKPNCAFFEVWGSEGIAVMERVSARAQELGLIVIADGKRNDIGSTATAYAEAFLGEDMPYDALTVTPYLGQDGVLPFVKKAKETGKGIFVLVKTSNPSSGEFQDLPVGDALLHEEVARAVSRWGLEDVGESGFSSVGAVVGATHPDELRILRSEMPSQIFLVPGYGAQGGSAEDIAGGFYAKGKGALINSSRGILFASNGTDYAEKAGEAAKKASEELWAVVGE